MRFFVVLCHPWEGPAALPPPPGLAFLLPRKPANEVTRLKHVAKGEVAGECDQVI